jgi:hypothetical protein
MALVVDGFRAAATAAALVLLLFGQPMQPLIGHRPVPKIVGMTDLIAAEQGGDTVGQAEQVSLLQWGIREGGAFVVILVILFFYRRDWKTAVEFWRDQHAITTDLVIQATKAQVSMEAALRENTVVVHQTKGVIQNYIPAGRRDDPPRK